MILDFKQTGGFPPQFQPSSDGLMWAESGRSGFHLNAQRADIE